MKEYNGKEVTIMTCSNCNANCKHCYISYKGNFQEQNLYNLVKELRNKYRVLLNGTEILLHPEYFDTIELLKQDYILTNGLIIYEHPEIIPKLKSMGIKYIDSSYHFFIHDEISTVNSKIVEDNIQRLLQYGIKTELRTTITSYNYKLVEEMCDLAKNMGACGIKFTNYLNIGNAQNLETSNILTEEQIEFFFKQLDYVRKKYNRNEFLIRRCGSFEKNLKNPNCGFKCTAICDSIAITPDLKVYPCFFLTIPGYEIGYVQDNIIYIDENIKNDGTKCLAKKIYNDGGKL